MFRTLAISIITFHTLAACCAAQKVVTESLETWFLLKNESTFPAEILGGEDRLRLKIVGGELEIRSTDIELMGFSLDDLADQRVQIAALAPPQKRWPIVEWCARVERYDHAERLLHELDRIEDQQPRVAGWRKHLERLKELRSLEANVPKPQPGLLRASESVEAQPIRFSAPQTNTASAARLDPAIRTATFEPLDLAKAATNPAHVAAVPATLKLPEAVPGILPEALSQEAHEYFIGRMQNLLVNRCATAGCHETKGKSEFKLERFSRDSLPSRTTTHKNLQATLRYVRTDRPEESPLASQAFKPHGGALEPPIQPGEGSTIASLRTWLQLLTPTRPLPVIQTTPAVDDPEFSGVLSPGKATFPASLSTDEAAPSLGSTLPTDVTPGWQSALQREKQLRAAEARVAALRDDTKTKPSEANSAEPQSSTIVPAAESLRPSTTPPSNEPKYGVPSEIATKPVAQPPVRSGIPGMPFREKRTPAAQESAPQLEAAPTTSWGDLSTTPNAKTQQAPAPQTTVSQSTIKNPPRITTPLNTSPPLKAPPTKPKPSGDPYDASIFDAPR